MAAAALSWLSTATFFVRGRSLKLPGHPSNRLLTTYGDKTLLIKRNILENSTNTVKTLVEISESAFLILKIIPTE